MTRPIGYSTPIPTFTDPQILQPGEKSISAWKTQVSEDGKSVTIVDESEGDAKFLNQTFPIVRYEYGGARIVFKV
jgi:hypothetical protein